MPRPFWLIPLIAFVVSCAETKFDSNTKDSKPSPDTVGDPNGEDAEKKQREDDLNQGRERGDTTQSGDPDGDGGDKDDDVIVAERTGMLKLTFRDETAGFENSLGWYKVNSKGELTDPEIIWNNASHSSGFRSAAQTPDPDGPVQPGDTITVGPIQVGESARFFLVADGFHQNNWDKPSSKDYINTKKGHFEFRTDADYDKGDIAKLSSKSPYLFYIPDSGSPFLVKSRDGIAKDNGVDNAIYHAAYDTENSLSLNPDNHNHIRHKVLKKSEKWQIGVEDLYFKKEQDNEYDGDYSDLLFEVELLPVESK